MRGISSTALSFVAVAALLGVLVYNALTSTQRSFVDSHYDPYTVSGISVIHRSNPYTLNFRQQQELIGTLNRGYFLKSDAPENMEPFPFQGIVIHRFGQNDEVLTPIKKSDSGDIVFRLTVPNSPDRYLRETSGGSLESLIETTYLR